MNLKTLRSYAAGRWAGYLSRWTGCNHLRAAASFAAADQLEKCLQAGFDEIVELGRRTS